jgi:uncharacterized tellurite resistance protein B-like protein
VGLLDWLFKKKDKPTEGGPKAQTPRTQAQRTEPAPHLRPPATPSPKRQIAVATPSAVGKEAGSDAKWISAGQRIKIHGYEIQGGMLYIGRGLKTPSGQVEPALIDPDLPVNSKRSRSPDPDLGYSPAYRTITPENRATYLAWLAGGRRDPSVPIGYVFLFMYGLERRVVVDILSNASLESELPAIRSEMADLLHLFGPINASFRRDATRFIDLIDIVFAQNTNRPLLSVTLNPDRWSVPTTLRIELGTRAAQGMAIPADLALAWAWYLPEHSPRTAATRCKDEFARLFAIRFDQKYPGGLVIRPGKARVQLSYAAASAGLHQQTLRLPDIPDIFEQKVPGKKLIELFDSVTDELDAYSRWLARNPDGAGSLAAVALLPPELAAQSTGAVQQVRDWANRQLGQHATVKVPSAELVRMWPSATSDRLAKSESVSLAQLLGTLGYGIEPDVRFGGAPFSADAQIVLFRVPPDAPHSTTPGYNAAMTLVHLARAVGMADGDVSYQEIDLLGEHLESSLHLLPAEKARLHAHLMWLTTADIKLAGLKRRLDVIDPTRRLSIGNLLVSIAAADGVVSPSEVTILTKIFGLLGLDPTLVTSQLHASLTRTSPPPATNPVVVRPGGAPEPGYRIPPPKQQGKTSPATATAPAFVLDDAVLQQKIRDTSEVTALLGNIFEDPEDEIPSPTSHAPSHQTEAGESVPRIDGLDGAHSLLLRALAKRGEWNRTEFEDLATEYHLMPDGAIDMLNEVAYDTTGEPVIEGDDVLTVNTYAMEQLLA